MESNTKKCGWCEQVMKPNQEDEFVIGVCKDCVNKCAGEQAEYNYSYHNGEY